VSLSELFGVDPSTLIGVLFKYGPTGRTHERGPETLDAAGIPYRTVQRWVAQYRLFGLAALARKRREDRGERRVVSAKLKEVIEGLALQKPPLPLAALFRQVQRLSKDLGEKAPSYGTVFSIVRDLGTDLVTLAHEGTKAYSNTFELVHRREATGTNAIWQADHTPLDILLIRPDGEPAKPWLSIVIDDYSRAVAGYFLSFQDPSALHTSLALRQAIWRKEDARWIVCGIPDVLYTDNGSDFTSNHLEQVGADLKIRLVFSIPGKPRGRGRIERFFSTVNEMLLCELDGYAPAGGAVRGEANAYAGRVRYAIPRLPSRRVPPPSECRNKDTARRTLGSQRLSAANAGLSGTTGPAADSSGQGAPGAGRWDSLPEPPLHLDNAGGVRWGNGHAAIRSKGHGGDPRLP
jgi:transposase InsO family protein